MSDDERTLWQKVAESVQPLKRVRPRPAPPPPEVDAAPQSSALVSEAAALHPPLPPKKPHRTKPTPSPGPKPAVKPAPRPLNPIDAQTRRKIARGSLAIEGRIDLHGLTQDDAHAALRVFIVGARRRGLKIVLVITGKGRRSDGAFHGHDVFSPGERGVLRRLVPHWLAAPDLRDHVVGFEEAHVAHGGAGAIYVRIRALKTARPAGPEDHR